MKLYKNSTLCVSWRHLTISQNANSQRHLVFWKLVVGNLRQWEKMKKMLIRIYYIVWNSSNFLRTYHELLFSLLPNEIWTTCRYISYILISLQLKSESFSKENLAKRSSNTLLCLVRFFETQTLCKYFHVSSYCLHGFSRFMFLYMYFYVRHKGSLPCSYFQTSLMVV